MSEFKAVQTEYKGYLFRSRLEARWAVFFDTLGIQWEYEPEGIVLSDGTHYLPDFYLPDFHCFFEVKRKGIRVRQRAMLPLPKSVTVRTMTVGRVSSALVTLWMTICISSARKRTMAAVAAGENEITIGLHPDTPQAVPLCL